MRKKVNNFVRFMRKLDGKPVPKEFTWDKESLRRTDILDLYSLRLTAQGNFIHLNDAFVWRTSPQGHDYWYVREEGIEELSGEDFTFLRELLDYYSTQDMDDDEHLLDVLEDTAVEF